MKKLISFIVGITVAISGFSANINALLPDERNTIEVFQKSSPKVVYVHRLIVKKSHSSIKKYVPDGAGSGIIWDNKGHIVTNFHVIKGADNLSVSLGKLTVPARLIGTEPRKDIAVLKINSPQALAYLKTYKPFTVVHLNELYVGQKAIAIGNPYGLDHSLSKGVISALGRKVPGIAGIDIRNMIQTDAPINPGNSGGPLLNSAGQLIGLNTVIYSQSGSSAGVGFAVPADDIERMVSQIITHGRVVLSGIGIQRVEPHLAKKLGIKKGILIGEIIPNTPAAQKRLHGTYRNKWGHVILGDVIVAVNTHPVTSYDTLYNYFTEIKVGEDITLTVLRGSKQMDIKMKTIDVAGL